jgi:flagellar biosynthesis GTPase FlhF
MAVFLFFFVAKVAATELRALAEYTELNIPIFYAALHHSKPIDNPELWYQPEGNRVMEFRFIADRLSVRSFSRSVLERILVTNHESQVNQYQDEIQQFMSLIRQPYVTGDRLIIRNNQGENVVVSVNDVEMLTFDDSGVFNLFLNMWLGEKLRSQSFYRDLTAPPSPELIAQYANVKTSSQRMAWAQSLKQALFSNTTAVASNDNDRSDSTEAKSSKTANQRSEVAKANPKAKPTSDSAKVLAKSETKTRSTSANQTKSNNKTVTQAEPKANPKPSRQENSVNESRGEKAHAESSRKASAADSSEQQSVAKTVPANKPEKAPQSTKLSPLLQELKNDYLADLQEKIRLSANPRPPITVRKVPQQDIEVEVTVLNDGTVDKVTFKDDTASDDLKSAITYEVSRLKSLPKPPELLNTSSNTVVVSFNFAKCRRTPSAWLCF